MGLEVDPELSAAVCILDPDSGQRSLDEASFRGKEREREWRQKHSTETLTYCPVFITCFSSLLIGSKGISFKIMLH